MFTLTSTDFVNASYNCLYMVPPALVSFGVALAINQIADAVFKLEESPFIRKCAWTAGIIIGAYISPYKSLAKFSERKVAELFAITFGSLFLPIGKLSFALLIPFCGALAGASELLGRMLVQSVIPAAIGAHCEG